MAEPLTLTPLWAGGVETGKMDRIRSKVAVSWAYPRADGWEARGHAWLSNVEAQPAWAMFCDTALWQKILGGPGSLDVHPAAPWHICSTADVQQFLEATR